MKSIILLVGLLIMSFAQAEVYKYTNKQGKTAYSDTPTVGSKKIIVPPVMTYKAPVIQLKLPVTEQKTLGSDQAPYQQLKITSPAEQEAIRSNQGTVNVAYSLKPALKEGDRIELTLDGVPQQGLSLQTVDRGQHVIRMSVFNKVGEELISSENVTFYLLRHSIQ